ncbi:LacI family DNA-binding transcriptional regulator [Halalkalibacter flavus]|uniref:LacI family DNA-binding transcriptional regulator n=1 Tax=Halalkalibacter flavus TaxID=3090668 RepID=UPI002FCC3CF5
MKMSDVAKLANVSTATVSRVISKPNSVSIDKRQRVLDVIKELNYQPHIIARQFKTNKTKTILVVVPDVTSAFFAEVLRGIEHIAIKNDYLVILGNTENKIDTEKKFVNLLPQRQVDGMVMLTARLDKKTLEDLSKKYPLVLACEYIEGLTVPTVSIDNISCARKVTEHLIRLGHTKIAHITGPINVILSRDRLKGYQEAMINNGLDIVKLYIQEGNFCFESGYDQMSKLLALEDRPTAVFIFNDEMAMGAIRAIKDSELNVPEDIAVVSFDNVYMSSVCEPRITTVNQPKYEIGRIAMDLLLKLINGEEVQNSKIILKDELIIRDSCGSRSRQYRVRGEQT